MKVISLLMKTAKASSSVFLCPTSWSKDKYRMHKCAFQTQEQTEGSCIVSSRHFSPTFAFILTKWGVGSRDPWSLLSELSILNEHWQLWPFVLLVFSYKFWAWETKRLRGEIVLLKVKHFCKSYHQDPFGVLLLLFPRPDGFQNLGTVSGAKVIFS